MLHFFIQSALTRTLSNRMRSVRFHLKRKRIGDWDESRVDEKKKTDVLSSCFIKVEEQGRNSDADYITNKNEARKESMKSNQSSVHIKSLLKESYNNRLVPWKKGIICIICSVIIV